jgi:hypothetical protein
LEPQRFFFTVVVKLFLFQMGASAWTVVSPLRFSKRNVLYFLCGVVRWAVAMEHDRTYLLAPTSGRSLALSPAFVCYPKQV